MNSNEPAFTVRPASPEDLLSVLRVHARRDSDGQLPVTASEVEGEMWAHMFEVPGLSVYLAEIDGDAVGTASAMLFPNITYDCQPTAIIEAVVVVHEYRRQGVATSLLRHILKDMKSAGCNEVQLLSHKRIPLRRAPALHVPWIRAGGRGVPAIPLERAQRGGGGSAAFRTHSRFRDTPTRVQALAGTSVPGPRRRIVTRSRRDVGSVSLILPLYNEAGVGDHLQVGLSGLTLTGQVVAEEDGVGEVETERVWSVRR